MQLSKIVSAAGALIAGLGGLCAAFAAPAPGYSTKDGSVVLTSIATREGRIRAGYLQKGMPWFLGMVGVGSFMQAVANFLP